MFLLTIVNVSELGVLTYPLSAMIAPAEFSTTNLMFVDVEEYVTVYLPISLELFRVMAIHWF